MAVSKDMAIYVKDLLMEEEMNGARLISGEEGLDNEIKGVTIIHTLFQPVQPRDWAASSSD